MKKDQIYNQPVDPLSRFTFDSYVADVFPDMIARSVPGYATTLALTGVLANKYAKAGTNCYDLGCSLGAATLAMRHHIQAEPVKFIAIDNSPAMIERAGKILDRDTGRNKVELLCQDIRKMRIENASVVVLNFTLQFINPTDRKTLISEIYRGLISGGLLILSEKVLFTDPVEQELQTAWHLAFKKANGYSELEIAGKRNALEDVLIPESETDHHLRLKECGFSRVYTWSRNFNFLSMAAVK